jgi:hypothetical protein
MRVAAQANGMTTEIFDAIVARDHRSERVRQRPDPVGVTGSSSG